MRLCLPVLLCVLITGCGSKTVNTKSETCLDEIPSLVKITAGSGTVGSDTFYPEERPVRKVDVDMFDIDATEVTNAQFAKFVEATGYVTSAEKEQPGFDMVGAAVFSMPTATQPNPWQFVKGADWRHPDGPESSIDGRDNDPVVQVSYDDAKAFAKWAGRRLPTEIEWEIAARAGADTTFPWGEERVPGGKEQANTWQGAFPFKNTVNDGYLNRAPVGCYPANGNGVYDMIGNVWEWTETSYRPTEGEPVYTIKGGSYLCAENYCQRYRASARQPQEAGLPTNHIGFRTVGSSEN